MTTITLDYAAKTRRQPWKTQAYHGKYIHVRAALREHREVPSSGQAMQWGYKVRISDGGPTATVERLPGAESDPDASYATQAVTEDAGFTHGRELVDTL